MAVYIVDSNFFIQAHRANYPLDVAASFWNKVKQLAEDGIIISIDKVRDELYDKNDELEAWCKTNLPQSFFKDTSSIMSSYATVSAWAAARSSQYTPGAINEFLDADEADAFIISFALADQDNRIVVTQEVSRPDSKKSIKIPDVCISLGVQVINTVQMFRQLGETF
jgi:hypothetical protein